ncbi:PTS mannose/fructose/sorbose/N-acetylgalactosamine transporter subunit IIC [Anaeropeptidivorans aminofermentans]|uniref:PTS mannose/fructose/sorbose/N-acetylgalactosamine transporter subunit IIC n=1 Tax=Anaeropeptidivorans aminofermentans TaxID=2934315 RepID=UPI0020248BDD|nr:PTS sugar transporter subunit IIC [Anaeropeptidivorans aminofermentans]MBE6012461.1 PTS sugar transporter subunit IIC [Lachnospiraceae bacterium]
MHIIQCILVALVHVLGIIDGRIFGQNLMNTPIVEAALVGLIMGDLQTGLIMGATLQLIFMGFVGIGATSLPNSSAGTILAVFFAISSNLDAESAIALSMPIALLFQPCGIIPRIINNMFNPRCDAAAAAGNEKAIEKYFWAGVFMFFIIYFVPMFLATYFGQGPVEAILNFIPPVVLSGLNKASTMLPALGIALLMNYIIDGESMPYMFLGFILAAYLGLDSLGVAALGLIIAVIYYGASRKKQEA